MPHRRSIESMESPRMSLDELRAAMGDATDEEERLNAKRSWRAALTTELKFLDARQDKLDERIDEAIEKEETILRLHNQLDQLCNGGQKELLEKLKKLSARVISLEKAVEELQKENQELQTNQNVCEECLADIKATIHKDIEPALDSNQNKIRELDDSRLNLIKRVEEISNYPPQMNNTGLTKPKIKAPVFKGENWERPIKFMKDLKNYIEVTNTSNKDLIAVINPSFQGAAEKWLNIYEKEINSYDDLYRLFTEHYWNAEIQYKARKRIINGYYSKEKRSRVEYALELFALSMELSPNYQESEIINDLRNHFSREVRSALTRKVLQPDLTDFNNLWICCSTQKNKRHVFFFLCRHPL